MFGLLVGSASRDDNNKIDIPCEMMKTRVMEYKQRLLICRKRLEYGHGKSVCQKDQRCNKCSAVGHERLECTVQQVKCIHCEGNHEVGSELCVEHRYQQEIVAVQTKERVSRMQAKIIFDKNNSQFRIMNYAMVAKVNTEGNKSTDRTSKSETQQQQQQVLLQTEEVARQGEVEVVCMSPNSGHLYTQAINIASAAERSSELADRTGENSAIVRGEVREIYDQQSEEMSLRKGQEEN